MNTNKIKELLEKYYEGNTSDQEEKDLLTYFQSENIDEELLPDKDMFMFYQYEKNTVETDTEDIENLILAAIENEEQKEQKQNEKRKIRPLFYLSQVAAVAVVLVVGYFMINQISPSKDMGTYSDPAIAMAETAKVFELLSQTMNKGTNELAPINAFSVASKELNKTRVIDQANKELEKVGELGKGFQEMNKIVETVIK